MKIEQRKSITNCYPVTGNTSDKNGKTRRNFCYIRCSKKQERFGTITGYGYAILFFIVTYD